MPLPLVVRIYPDPGGDATTAQFLVPDRSAQWTSADTLIVANVEKNRQNKWVPVVKEYGHMYDRDMVTIADQLAELDEHGVTIDDFAVIWAAHERVSAHHHLIHRPGWQLKLLPDATLELTNPNGHTQTSHPKPRSALTNIRLQP